MPSRPTTLLVGLTAVALLLAACGSGPSSTETLAEALEERTGRAVNEADLEGRVRQAERLCVLRDDLLGAVLDDRTAIELTIYDAYFDVWCPERADAYLALRPGEAIGVVGADEATGRTSTTVPAETSTSTTERAP